MDEQRIQAYLNLINTLLLNRESEAEINKILNDNQELIDSGLWQTMFQVAEQLAEGGDRDNAEFLLNIASQLAYEDYTNFLIEILQATAESEGNPKVVYQLLQQNLDKLDNNFADVLRNWATAQFSEVEADAAEAIAYIIGDFSNLIQQFPLGNKAANMEISIAGYELISTVFTRNSHPENWATTQNNLGIAYSDRITGDKAENLESAIAAYQNALLVYTQKDFPIDWATTQNNLGNAYSDRITGDKAENIESAIAAYQNALLVYTQKDFPINWATTQNNLGNAYSDRITGDKAENMESAIAAYQNALLVRTQKDFPINWATTQNNLGNAYRERITGDKAENMESAIAAFQKALQVYTQKDFPIDWAGTQNNLGNAYSDRITGDKAENIESAIAAFHNALLVYTQKDFPIDWAMTQNNLGAAYWGRITGEKAENIESAIAAYQNALLVRTQKDFPIDWAMTQNNLGAAYWGRITGEKAENMESAIAAYQNALLVRTLEANPLDHLITTRNLGNLYFHNQDWQLAADNYEKAITAVELSRSWATTEERRQEIIAENIDIYDKAILAYIYIDRRDKALEIAERSQARNLVELLTNRNLLPKSDVPPEVMQQFQQRQTEIRIGKGELEKVRQKLSGQDVQKRPSLEESEKRLNEKLQELGQQLETVLNQIQEYDPTFRLTQEVQPITFGEIEQLATEEQTAFIEWYIMADKFVTFVILPPTSTADSELFIRQSTEDDLKNLVEWVNEYLDKYDELQQAYRQREENLYKYANLQQEWETQITTRLEKLGEILHINEIIQPILERKCERLTLVPHLFLHLLPLHALPVAIPNPPKSPLERGTLKAPPLKKGDFEGSPLLKGGRGGSKCDPPKSPLERGTLEASHLERGTVDVSNPPKSPLERGTFKAPHLERGTLEASPSEKGTLEAPPLQRGAGGGLIYLQDCFSQGIRYAPSCQILQKVRQRQCQDFQSLFAIQTPTPDLYEQDLSVVSAIKEQFDEAEILKENQATKSAVINHPKLSVANSILFFCHGEFNFNSPLDSGLELADGTLTLADIIQSLNLKNCRLVTLAACETGLIDLSKETDEYVGLPSGFLLAGSTNIVASLWSVRTDVTALLMLRLYQELEKSDNIVVALKKAQNWLRNTNVQKLREWVRQSPLISIWQVELEQEFTQMENQEGANFKPYESPYFWAGFCVVGKGE